MNTLLKLIIVVILLLFGQTAIRGIKTYNSNQEGIEYSYTLGKLTINPSTELDNNNFTRLNINKPPIIGKGEYWLKIRIDKEIDDMVLTFNSHAIRDVLWYHIDKDKLFIPREIKSEHEIELYRLSSFNLENSKENTVYYYHFSISKGTILSLNVVSKAKFYKNKITSTFLAGGYYCFLLIAILISTFYYIEFKKKIFLIRALVNILFILLLAVYNGATYTLLGNSANGDFLCAVLYIMILIISGNNYVALLLKGYSNTNYKNTIERRISILACILLVVYIFNKGAELYYISMVIMITVFIIGLIKAYRASKHTNELALHVISTGVLAVFFTLYVIQVVFKTHTVIVDESTLKYALAIEVLTAQYIIDLIARKERAKLDKSTLSSTEFEKTTNRRKGKSKLDTLSAREREVYNLIIEGYRTNEISNRLYISVNTVKFHKKNIYRKMNVCTQDELLKLNEQTQSCSQTNG